MYTTKAHMIERFGEEPLIELTDRAEPATHAIVDTTLDMAIISANSVIDSYLSPRYKMPIDPVPDVIRAIASSIAYYYLCRERYTEETRRAYDDAMSLLKDIAAGKAKLDVQGYEPEASFAEARVIAPERVFNRESLAGF